MKPTSVQKATAQNLFQKYLHSCRQTKRLDIFFYRLTAQCAICDIVWKIVIDSKLQKEDRILRKLYKALHYETCIWNSVWYVQVKNGYIKVAGEASQKYLANFFNTTK